MRLRSIEKFPTDGKKFRSSLLVYSQNSNTSVWLEGQGFSPLLNSESRLGLFAYGVLEEFISSGVDSFANAQKFYFEHEDWIFGCFSYDLKNEIEDLSSENIDNIGFPLLHLICPELIFEVCEEEVRILFWPEQHSKNSISELFHEIESGRSRTVGSEKSPDIQVQCRFTKKEYEDSVNEILNHIQRGDIYEMNFCMEFFAENVLIDPAEIFSELYRVSPMPFSCFYRSGERYLMCASPERFIRKEKNRIISQPMKGTARRGNTETEDKEIIEELKYNKKEQSENHMIVDLVRNDLSKVAERNSVRVDELCGVYTFPGLHQMISTVSADTSDKAFTEIIQALFPMGSMTGAPKIRAMELIEKFEKTKRGLFSGSVGYIDPQRNFDFNVIIRSILYNNETKYLSYQAGSAITASSLPEKEYQECLLKAAALFLITGLLTDSVHA